VFAVSLQAVVLDDVRVVQILQKVDFVLDHGKFSLALLLVGLFRQFDALDGK